MARHMADDNDPFMNCNMAGKHVCFQFYSLVTTPVRCSVRPYVFAFFFSFILCSLLFRNRTAEQHQNCVERQSLH